MASLRDWLFRFLDRRRPPEETTIRVRGPATHVIIIDGTMSTLAEGRETNAGLTLKLLREVAKPKNLTLYYEAGLQWRDWSGTYGVLTGKGINRQIRRAYGVLASRYHEGDKIVLIGYSRGAYVVRTLAGIIDTVGLVRADQATERTILQAYRHYRTASRSPTAATFSKIYCHPNVPIEAVAVWDTVKAIGLRLPIIWRWMQPQNDFHDSMLGAHVKYGFHALALNETREAYAPVMWRLAEERPQQVEQVWFHGAHGDIGGQLGDFVAARPLANISLVWMLQRLADCGLPLPENWRDRFPQDVTAPSVGTWTGWAKMFLSRRRRIIGADPSERLDDNAALHRRSLLLFQKGVAAQAKARRFRR